ncbi:hypothetical protein SAMD00019534_013740 [Acytostelium subglobosum LB1]|uniref:hypothetical protein n=1 Tax=Acytostelium subglobosum LB1 TaxID=1410327 RepID=UPI0006451484|nr:hypothetical protein SAMD00019534_013740 [Acytostelium subglobosum LB1]GAM18199.1 hypothetical protein SAMD00019534_013740 [Acytostelium subglobosum LB1]|eukprot:XP_012758795.1 hypothetical protein SAMD00019534_013740 [Acytostelium subglobosum LB1]
MDEYTRLPSKYTFDKDNNVFFLSSSATQSNMTINYINLDNCQKESIMKPLFYYKASTGKMSLEEELMRERQRTVGTGISSYQFNQDTKHFLAAMGNDLYTIDVAGATIEQPKLKKLNADTYDPKLSSDCKMVAFIDKNDLWVTDLQTQQRHRLTHSHDVSPYLSSGEAKFVYSEEFSRYTGYWWAPKLTSANKYQIFYFEEDERNVRDFHIPEHGYEGTFTHYKYPLAGDENSRVKLGLLTFTTDSNGALSVERNMLDLSTVFPWAEYYVRGDWTPDGQVVWVQLVDRLQQRLELVTIPVSCFGNAGGATTSVLIQESQPQYWVNVTDHLTFLDGSSLLWTSERSGYRHIYHLSWSAGYTDVKTRQLTSGEWVVTNIVSVDKQRKLVYFEANRETPLENHLYVCSYDTAPSTQEIRRLTIESHDHDQIAVSPDHTKFVSNYSSATNAPVSLVCRLEFAEGARLPTPSPLTAILTGKPNPSVKLRPSTLFKFQNSKGRQIYGRYQLPENHDPSRKYPVVVLVYGGPHVQLVRNTYSLARQFYSSFGFISVIVDGTGSDNRGIAFEGQLREAMGTIEIPDQVEALEYLANASVPIDLARVAITGWSYGGYLALMGIAQRPDIFKIAISGAPVTFWESYNTGYTERYMNTPANSPKGYKNGNVLSYLDQFPDEENRLIVIHGMQDENVHFANTSMLVEELSSNGKPYILKMLGKERHGIRDFNNRITIESFKLNHLLKYL